MDEGRVRGEGGDQGEGGDPAGAPGSAAGPARGAAAGRGGGPGGWRTVGRSGAPRRGTPQGARARPGVFSARRRPGPEVAPRRKPAWRRTRGGDGPRPGTPGLRGADPQPRGGGCGAAPPPRGTPHARGPDGGEEARLPTLTRASLWRPLPLVAEAAPRLTFPLHGETGNRQAPAHWSGRALRLPPQPQTQPAQAPPRSASPRLPTRRAPARWARSLPPAPEEGGRAEREGGTAKVSVSSRARANLGSPARRGVFHFPGRFKKRLKAPRVLSQGLTISLNPPQFPGL